MSSFLKTAIFTGVPFGLFMGVFYSIQWGSPFGFVLGLGAGLLFGPAMAAFMAWQASRFTREVPNLEGERVLKQGPANHFRGWEGVGGWLYLTDKRLLFRSHRFNVQTHEWSVPLAEITEVQTCATAWIVPNGLRIVTAGGAERFVVNGRGSWVEEIKKAKG